MVMHWCRPDLHIYIVFQFQADRLHPNGKPFTYPYDFGWKENFKQVDIHIFTVKSVD